MTTTMTMKRCARCGVFYDGSSSASGGGATAAGRSVGGECRWHSGVWGVTAISSTTPSALGATGIALYSQTQPQWSCCHATSSTAPGCCHNTKHIEDTATTSLLDRIDPPPPYPFTPASVSSSSSSAAAAADTLTCLVCVPPPPQYNQFINQKQQPQPSSQPLDENNNNNNNHDDIVKTIALPAKERAEAEAIQNDRNKETQLLAKMFINEQHQHQTKHIDITSSSSTTMMTTAGMVMMVKHKVNTNTDTVAKLALMYNSSGGEIKRLNGLFCDADLYAHECVTVPVAAKDLQTVGMRLNNNQQQQQPHNEEVMADIMRKRLIGRFRRSMPRCGSDEEAAAYLSMVDWDVTVALKSFVSDVSSSSASSSSSSLAADRAVVINRRKNAHVLSF